VGETSSQLSRRSLGVVQSEHRFWLAHNFPGQTREQVVLGMVEEMGELAHHVLKRDQHIRHEDHEAEIRDACADLVIFMCGLADLEGFELMEVISETWSKVKQRDWVKFPQDGVST